MNSDNDEFSRRIAATLDRSAEHLDGDTRQQLQLARQQALAGSRFKQYYRPALAIAAGVMALMVAPWLTWQQLHQNTPTVTMVDDGGYLNEDPELLSDWDMLDAIGESPDA